MANTAASILRTLVAKHTDFKPEQIQLSGEIPVDYNLNKGTAYNSSAGSSCNTYLLWGFHPEQGFVQIETRHSWSNGSGERCNYEPEYLYNIENVDKYIFFVETNEFNEGSWKGSETEYSCIVYKASNFEAKRKQISEADIQRWENWIKE